MKDTWKRFKQNRFAFVGFLFIALILVVALFAKWIVPYDPYFMDSSSPLTSPNGQHWFGTDQFGRDIFSRILYGTQISLKVGLIAVGFSLFFGTIIGIVAGYFGGKIDQVLSRITDVLFAFPDILLALVIMAILGPSLTNLMIAIGIVYTPIFARIARGAVLSIRDSLYIEAARSMGVNSFQIMLRHILPNSLAPLIVQVTLSFAFAILAEAALSFLGLGVSPDTPSWGIMLSEAKDWMEISWWTAIFPGVAITLAVLSFNIMGDGLRDALDPRLKNER
ncbi:MULTISPECIES: ABC transporter permease [Sporosarcina]|uniref:ABC transporter permease n=1 Tax=Sporosarcina TaxID=1569 RepID=UPI00129A6677|nr:MULTISPECIES: ABC transporter permease [Sporosarcina]GKV65891.1 peptide ABC transporter permease [Sporosarcina sp. NCCP-2331]GLB56016.1 peptide ABC transporter permease [Sporosarcina sp. NCCP-2378]